LSDDVEPKSNRVVDEFGVKHWVKLWTFVRGAVWSPGYEIV